MTAAKLPALQRVQLEPDARGIVPAAQGRQTAASASVVAAVTWPPGHALQAERPVHAAKVPALQRVHTAASVAEIVPVAQATHVDIPVLAANLPASQLVQTFAPRLLANLPCAHATQMP